VVTFLVSLLVFVVVFAFFAFADRLSGKWRWSAAAAGVRTCEAGRMALAAGQWPRSRKKQNRQAPRRQIG
jgi:hypothetical protein